MKRAIRRAAYGLGYICLILTAASCRDKRPDNYSIAGKYGLIKLESEGKLTELDTHISAMKLNGTTKHAYLSQVERGTACSKSIMERLALAGGAATIDDLTSEYDLHDMIPCPHLDSTIFCGSSSRALRTKCIATHVDVLEKKLQRLPSLFSFALKQGIEDQHGRSIDFKSGSVAIYWSPIVDIFSRIRDLEKEERLNCTSGGGDACKVASQIAAVRGLGQASTLQIESALKALPKTEAFSRPANAFLTFYKGIWK